MVAASSTIHSGRKKKDKKKKRKSSHHHHHHHSSTPSKVPTSSKKSKSKSHKRKHKSSGHSKARRKSSKSRKYEAESSNEDDNMGDDDNYHPPSVTHSKKKRRRSKPKKKKVKPPSESEYDYDGVTSEAEDDAYNTPGKPFISKTDDDYTPAGAVCVSMLPSRKSNRSKKRTIRDVYPTGAVHIHRRNKKPKLTHNAPVQKSGSKYEQLVSPAPSEWRIVSTVAGDESLVIKLKQIRYGFMHVLCVFFVCILAHVCIFCIYVCVCLCWDRNPINEALNQIGGQNFQLRAFMKVLADVVGHPIDTKMPARRRLVEELLVIPGVTFAYEYLEKSRIDAKMALKNASENTEFNASDFITNYFRDPINDGSEDFCFICRCRGDVICCDSCPHVFHPRCLGFHNIPTGDWFCNECIRKQNKQLFDEQPNEDIDVHVSYDDKLVNEITTDVHVTNEDDVHVVVDEHVTVVDDGDIKMNEIEDELQNVHKFDEQIDEQPVPNEIEIESISNKMEIDDDVNENKREMNVESSEVISAMMPSPNAPISENEDITDIVLDTIEDEKIDEVQIEEHVHVEHVEDEQPFEMPEPDSDEIKLVDEQKTNNDIIEELMVNENDENKNIGVEDILLINDTLIVDEDVVIDMNDENVVEMQDENENMGIEDILLIDDTLIVEDGIVIEMEDGNMNKIEIIVNDENNEEIEEKNDEDKNEIVIDDKNDEIGNQNENENDEIGNENEENKEIKEQALVEEILLSIAKGNENQSEVQMEDKINEDIN